MTSWSSFVPLDVKFCAKYSALNIFSLEQSVQKLQRIQYQCFFFRFDQRFIFFTFYTVISCLNNFFPKPSFIIKLKLTTLIVNFINVCRHFALLYLILMLAYMFLYCPVLLKTPQIHPPEISLASFESLVSRFIV